MSRATFTMDKKQFTKVIKSHTAFAAMCESSSVLGGINFKITDNSDIDEFIENELEGDDIYNGRFRKEFDTYYEGVFLTETDAKRLREKSRGGINV